MSVNKQACHTHPTVNGIKSIKPLLTNLQQKHPEGSTRTYEWKENLTNSLKVYGGERVLKLLSCTHMFFFDIWSFAQKYM